MSLPTSIPALIPSSSLHGIASVPHLGVIRATGADAANFLHHQLTNDVLLLKPDECRLAAFCNAKGRMQASFVLYKRTAEDVLLICRHNLIAQTIKRLSLFVLRAKVQLSDASQAFQLRGLAGDTVVHTLPAGASSQPGLRYAMGDADVLTLYPAGGQARALWVAPVGVDVPAADALSTPRWQVGEVMSGVAWVEHATFEAFVPQMLNYESVEGVNFQKGCYPGQEVVARSQFRGTLKRRAFIVQCAAPLRAGQEIFSSADPTQPCGLVAQAAVDGADHVGVVVLQLSATQGGSLHVEAATGATLNLLPLPYRLREDI